jgi:predicted small metal-binding protein
MTKVIRCPCGYLIHEADDDRLVESAQMHARSAHAIELTREQALAMAKPELTGGRTSDGEGSEV